MREINQKYLFSVFLDVSIICSFIYILWHPFDLSYIFLDTHVSGGDMISHPWITRSLKNLWANGQFWGWNDGWGAGFPFLYFYFYPVYVIANIYDFLGFPEAVAFKLMVFSVVSLLPIVYYVSGRKWLTRPRAFLFTALGFFIFLNGDSSYYGGNFKSVLAGQISHHLGLLCLVIYYGLLTKKKLNSISGIIFLSLCVLSHVYSGIYAILFTLLFFFVEYLKTRNYKEIIKYFKGPAIGVGLTAFFWIPLIYYRNYTVTPVNQWVVNMGEIVKIFQLKDPWYVSLYLLATALTIGNLFNKKSENRFHLFSLLLLALASGVIMPLLVNSPILHIRLVPQVFLISIILITSSLNELKLKKSLSHLVAVLLGALFLQANIPSPVLDKVLPTSARMSFKDLPNWWKWNMEGIESKAGIKDVLELWKFMKEHSDSEGRFAFEYHDYNNYGSPRIFELTPFMTGKSVFESLLMESSANYVSSYYTNFLVKRETWWPGFLVKIPSPDIKKAVKSFSLFNMKYFVAHTKAVRTIFENEEIPVLYQNKSFKVFIMNPTTRIASILNGAVPSIESLKPLYESVLSLPKSLENFVTIKKGNAVQTFPDKTTQSLEPLEGQWEENKQSYFVPNTTASKQNPKKIIFKISYFPNWSTSTGEEIKLVSPNLMLVETIHPELRISYSSGFVEKFSFILSILTLINLLWSYVKRTYSFKRSN